MSLTVRLKNIGISKQREKVMAHTNEAAIDLDWHSLSDEEIRYFDDNGYLIVRNVLDPDTIEELIEASDRLMASDRLENRQHNSNNLYDSFRNCVSIDDAFIPLLTQKTILPIVVQLLGAHLQLMTSHLIYKHPDPPEYTRYSSPCRVGIATTLSQQEHTVTNYHAFC